MRRGTTATRWVPLTMRTLAMVEPLPSIRAAIPLAYFSLDIRVALRWAPAPSWWRRAAAFLFRPFVLVGYYGTGTLTLNSGGTVTFADSCQLEVGAYGGTGNVYQNGGTVNNLDASTGIGGDASFYIGPYGTGTYNFGGGTLNSPWTNVGYGGDRRVRGTGRRWQLCANGRRS